MLDDKKNKFKINQDHEIRNSAFALDKLSPKNDVQVRSRQVLDREKVPTYHITITDSNTKVDVAILEISVIDVNDNLPVFNTTSTRLVWNIKPMEAIKYAIVGKVSAYDPDLHDPVVYGLDRPDPCCIIVPQTGEVMLVDPEALPAQLTILAKEKLFPSRQSKIQALLDIINEDEILDDNNSLEPHSRYSRFILVYFFKSSLEIFLYKSEIIERVCIPRNLCSGQYLTEELFAD